MRTSRDLRHLLLTPLGRRQILWGAIFRASPLLRPMATCYRRLFLSKTRFVCVVGSFGKTTATRATMASLGLPCAHHIGWNSGGFLPLLMLLTTPRARHRVLEVGINRPGIMEQYAKWIRPSVAVVTSIGSEHMRSFGSLDSTRHEKAHMVRVLPPSGLAVLNGDDANVRWMATQTKARVVTVGFGEENDIRASDVRMEADLGTTFRAHVGGRAYDATIRLFGEHMILPILSALAVATAEGLSADVVMASLSALRAAPERMEPMRASTGQLLLLDSKKGAIETYETGLDVFREVPATRKLAVIGDIEEPPGPQGPLYKRLGTRLAEIVDHVVFVGGRNAHASVAAGAEEAGLPRGRVQYAGREVRKATMIARDLIRPGDILWIKGRSTQHLGRIGLALAGRKVTCNVTFCSHTPICAFCPMLERRSRLWKRAGA